MEIEYKTAEIIIEYKTAEIIKPSYISKLLGISEKEYNKLRKAFDEINNIDHEEMRKHPLFYSFEGLEKMERVYKTVIEIFSSINPENKNVKDVEEIKKFALTPIEELQRIEKENGSSTNYFRCNQASSVRDRLESLLTSKYYNYLRKRFTYVGKDHYGNIFYGPNAHGHIRIGTTGCKNLLEATKEINLEKIILEIEQTL